MSRARIKDREIDPLLDDSNTMVEIPDDVNPLAVTPQDTDPNATPTIVEVEPAEPTDTKAILTRLEKKNLIVLNKLREDATWIYRREQAKRLVPVASAAVGLACLGAIAYFIDRLVKLKNPTPSSALPNYEQLYASTPIDGTNETCGTAYPNNHAGDLCGQARYLKWLETDPYVKSDYSFEAAHSSIEDARCWEAVSTSCNQKMDATKTYLSAPIPDTNQNCGTLYPLSRYCDWNSIVGYAHDCLLEAKRLWQHYDLDCTNADVLNTYRQTVPPLSSATCGELLPMESLCDWREYMKTAAYHCADAANQICARWPDINGTQIPTGYACAARVSYSCDILMGSRGHCATAASEYCVPAASTRVEENLIPAWIVLLSTGIFFSILTLVMTLLNFKPKKVYSELSHEDMTKLRKSHKSVMNLESAPYDIGQLQENTSIISILDAIKNEEKLIEIEKQLLSYIRHTVRDVCEKINDNIEYSAKPLPRDTIKRIFFFANLTREDADKADKNNTEEIERIKRIKQ